MGRITASELVIHDDWDAVRSPEVADGQYVVVGDAWPAVEADEGPYTGVEGAKDGIPCFAGLVGVWGVEINSSFEGGDCHFGGSREVGDGSKGGDGDIVCRGTERKVVTAGGP